MYPRRQLAALVVCALVLGSATPVAGTPGSPEVGPGGPADGSVEAETPADPGPSATRAGVDLERPAAGIDDGVIRPSAPSDRPAVAAQEEPGNDSIRHVDPEAVDEPGDLEAVERWLSRQMSERLADSSVALSEGEYEQARSYLGEDYRELLGRYVDVAGETGGAGDDRAAGEFDRARDQQTELVAEVREYRRTYEEYREAKAAGDEQRARELARDLSRQAQEVNRTAAETTGTYRNVSNATGADLGDAEAAVADVRENVSERTAEAVAAEFVETRLTVAAESREISFREPLVVEGRLVAANGSVLADRVVVLRAGDRTVRTRTGDDGRFALRYRPTTVPAGEATVEVAYVPRNASVYLGSEAALSVEVTPVEPSLAATLGAERVRFGDAVPVEGSVTVGGVGAAGVPVVVALDGRPVARTTTGEGGRFAVAAAVPASVPAGDRELTVALPLGDRALRSVETSDQVTVERRSSELSVAAERIESGAGETGEGADQSDGDVLRVSGRLTATGGTPVPDAAVAVRLGETVLGAARTAENGTFSAEFDVPATVRPEERNATVALVAAFDGEGTNLRDARAETQVTLVSRDGGEGELASWLGFSTGETLALGAAAVVALAVAALALRRRRRRTDTGDGQAGGARSGGASAGGGGAGSDRSTTPGEGPSFVELARSRLEEGATDAAVLAAYEAVRRQLGEAAGVSAAGTHLEFLTASRDAGLGEDRLAVVEAVTEAYERAAFASGGVSREAAEAAVAALAEFDPSDPSAAADD